MGLLELMFKLGEFCGFVEIDDRMCGFCRGSKLRKID